MGEYVNLYKGGLVITSIETSEIDIELGGEDVIKVVYRVEPSYETTTRTIISIEGINKNKWYMSLDGVVYGLAGEGIELESNLTGDTEIYFKVIIESGVELRDDYSTEIRIQTTVRGV